MPHNPADALWFTTARVDICLAQDSNQEGISVMEHRMAEGFGPPRHVHHHEDETFYVLNGRFRFEAGGKTVEAGAGETVHIPRGVPHGFRVLSAGGGRFLTITSGGFEAMVRAVSKPAEVEGLPSQSPPTAAEQQMLAAAASANGIDLIGPPID